MIKPIPLKYSFDALEPFISKTALYAHYNYNYLSYIDKVNKLTNQNITRDNFIDIFLSTDNILLQENAAQIYNHEIFWNSLEPNSNKNPNKKIVDDIVEMSSTIFGSGWVWVAETQNNTIDVVVTKDAENPLFYGLNPLLCIDLWEHSFYIDYFNQRKQYIKNICYNLLDWDLLYGTL